MILEIEAQQIAEAIQLPAELDVTDLSDLDVALDLFPPGAYLDRDRGWLPGVTRAIARFFSRLRLRREAFVKNMDPRQADELLDDWEQTYGLIPTADQTLEDRRAAVLVRVRALGGSTAAYYQQLAIDFGYADALVADAADPLTTVSLADDFLQDGEWKLTFKVTAASQGAARDALLQDLINANLLAGWFALFEFT